MISAPRRFPKNHMASPNDRGHAPKLPEAADGRNAAGGFYQRRGRAIPVPLIIGRPAPLVNSRL